MASYPHRGPHGLMFHHFVGGPHLAGQGSISGREFEDILRFVGLQRFVSPAEWFERARTNSFRGDEVCVTFDDCLKCQYDIALPVLEKLGIQAFWFVYSSVLQGNIEELELFRHIRSQYSTIEIFYEAFYERARAMGFGESLDQALQGFEPKTYLSDFPFYTDEDRAFRFVRNRVLSAEAYKEVMFDLLKEQKFSVDDVKKTLWMAPKDVQYLQSTGHWIGLHSHTHPTNMGELPLERQRTEYGRNYEYLSGILPQPPIIMSHPCNSYSTETFGILEDLGIQLGFRANMKEMDVRSIYEFPREDHANILRQMGGQ